MRDKNSALSVVLVDWGGVLTMPLDVVWHTWGELEGIDPGVFGKAIESWLAADNLAQNSGQRTNSPMAQFERGEMPENEFEQHLAAKFAEVDVQVPAPGLIGRMLQGTATANTDMFTFLDELSGKGFRLGVLSNSWGQNYDRSQWGIFEHTIISCEVGARKPEPEIFHLAANRFDVEPSACVFIDDLPANITAAHAVGMTAVHYLTVPQTRTELTGTLGI